MPSSPSLSPRQSSGSETTHDHPLAAADAPEHPQPAIAVIPTIPGGLDRSATLEPLSNAMSRAENTVVNNPPPSPRTANNHARDSPGRQHTRIGIPDPVIAAPDPPRLVVHRTIDNPQRHSRLSIAGRILAFFGYGRNNKARKELVSIIWTLAVDFSQVILQLPVYSYD
jgi:hypothetical protein